MVTWCFCVIQIKENCLIIEPNRNSELSVTKTWSMGRQNSITTRQYYLQSDLSEVWNRIVGQNWKIFWSEAQLFPVLALCVASVSLENDGADTALGPRIIMVTITPPPGSQDEKLKKNLFFRSEIKEKKSDPETSGRFHALGINWWLHCQIESRK